MSSSRAATAGWALAASVYLLAVLHRTSLGIAGLLAERRFGIGPAQLSVFIFLQIGVYAAMQVPTGVLVDRYGPRRLLTAAALLMGAAQLVFALVPSYSAALLARAALGCGDALTFVSVLRFAAAHFGPRRYPVLVSLTATCGMLGNVVATLPLALVLRHVGWTPSFTGTALLSLVAGAAVAVLLPDTTPPPRAVRGSAALRAGVLSVRGRVRDAWALPGTRLGFWTHFTSMSTTTALAVLWGTPYLVTAVGLSTAQAGAVLMASVAAAATVAPLVGWFTGRRPAARVPLALGISALTVAGVLVLVGCFGSHPPAGYAVPLIIVAALGGPTSMAAFALARDYNRPRTLGTASGVVNVGGFVATVVVCVGIGVVLDVLGGTTAAHLRVALLVAAAVQVAGMARTTVWLLRTRAANLARQDRGEDVPVPVLRRRFDLAAPVPLTGVAPGGSELSATSGTMGR